MTVTEAKMLTMAAVILLYVTLLGSLLMFAGPDIVSLITLR